PVRIKCACLRQPASKLHSFDEHAQISFAAEIVGLDHWRRKRVTGAQGDAPTALWSEEDSNKGEAVTSRVIKAMIKKVDGSEHDFQIRGRQTWFRLDECRGLGTV